MSLLVCLCWCIVLKCVCVCVCVMCVCLCIMYICLYAALLVHCVKVCVCVCVCLYVVVGVCACIFVHVCMCRQCHHMYFSVRPFWRLVFMWSIYVPVSVYVCACTHDYSKLCFLYPWEWVILENMVWSFGWHLIVTESHFMCVVTGSRSSEYARNGQMNSTFSSSNLTFWPRKSKRRSLSWLQK